MNVFCTQPELAEGPRLPAILVLQEAFGVNSHIQKICHRFSELGFMAAAPEFFHRNGAGLTYNYTDFAQIRPMLGKMTTEMLLEDTTRTFDYLANQKNIDSKKIFTAGYCMGGYASVLLATERPVAGAISYYGGGMALARPGIGFSPLLDRLEKIHCPLQLVYGGQDQAIRPEEIHAVQNTLQSGNKDFQLEIYPDAGHGFFCDERSAYHERSALQAWDSTKAWLEIRI